MPLKSHHSHVLVTLGALFLIGAATRFLPERLAEAEETSAEQTEPASAEYSDDQAAFSSPLPIQDPENDASSDTCFSPEMAESLLEDRRLLEAETSKLTEERLGLQNWEEELTTRTNELQALQVTLEERWAQMQAAADQDIQHLVRMYGAMKPDRAAEIFNQMDPKFAAGFLRGMNSEQAGLILANMESSKAYQVSLDLAAINEDLRNQDTP